MKYFKDIALAVGLGLLMAVGIGAIFAVAEMWLWNQVMPDLFGWKEITYWQAFCISALSAMLIKATPSSLSKLEEHVERIRDLSQLQDSRLADIKGVHDMQLSVLDDLKRTLDSIERTLESSR